MANLSPIPGSFLPPAAPLSQKWVALRQNVQSWYSRWAIANGKTDIGQAGDLLWTYSQCTISSEAEALQQDGQQIDAILDWYRRQTPLRGAIFWYLNQTPPAPVQLAAKLYARGVGPNWEPHWMWCELGDDHAVEKPPEQKEERTTEAARAFEIRISGLSSSEDNDIPKDEDDTTLVSLTQAHPQRVWHLEAWGQHSRRVGSCTLNVTTGLHGIGGLFDMWVSEAARRQGIGTALAREMCALAYRLGCRAIVVNSTEEAEGIYRRAGFESLGWGVTWFLNREVLAKPRPGEEAMRFLEAVGAGNIEALEQMMSGGGEGGGLASELLSEPTLNGMTPLEIAVRCQQPGSASWLVDRGGVVPDIMSVWDLGWKDRVPDFLVAHPELVKRRGGRWMATPLHVAIERDDLEFARVLLTVPNDLESKDAVFQGTPMEWAERFHRNEFVALLKKHLNDQKK